MTRFVTANAKTLWAAIDPDTRYTEHRVADRRFSAYLTPFRTEEEAVAALVAAGGEIDVIQPLRKPGRQVRS
jgi:hypothetical protein